MESSDEWTAITRRDKAHRRVHRTKVVRDYVMAHRAQDTGATTDSDNRSPGSKATISDYVENCYNASGATGSAKVCDGGPKIKSYAAVASGYSENATSDFPSLDTSSNSDFLKKNVEKHSSKPTAASPTNNTNSIISSYASVATAGVISTNPDAPHAGEVSGFIVDLTPSSEPETSNTTVEAHNYIAVNDSSKHNFAITNVSTDSNNSNGVDSSDDYCVNLDQISNPVTSNFELGRAILSHLTSKKETIYEQLQSAGLAKNFNVESNHRGFTIISQTDLTQEEQSAVLAFIQRAKEEVLEKSCKLNYAGRGSGQFVVFQNGSEARHITSYDDERGVLVFADQGSSDDNLDSLKSYGEIIFTDKIEAKVTRDNNHNACGPRVNDKFGQRNLCAKVIFKSADAATNVTARYNYSYQRNDLFVKQMHNPDQSHIDEGSTLTFTTKFPSPVQEVTVHTDRIPYADKLQNIRTAANSSGTQIYDCHCPWYWVFRDNIHVRVDVRKLVEKHGWTESYVKSNVIRSVSRSIGMRLSSEASVVRGGAPKRSNYLIRNTKNFIDGVVGDYVRTGACNVYLSPLTTDETMIIEAVFKNPEDAKFVAFEKLPERLAAFSEPDRPNYRAFPYFCRKQLSPRIYQAIREGLDVLHDSVEQKYNSVVTIESAPRKNGGAVLFVKATRRDVGERIGKVLNNIISPAELKLASDGLSSFNLFSTFSCKRWMKFLENRYKVHIYVDEFRERISIYGPPEIRARVKREIEEWHGQKVRKTTVINVDEHKNYWSNIVEKYRLQLESLAMDCGAENVLFNFKTKQLVVVGTKSSVTKLRHILSTSSNVDREAVVSGDECVACFCDISESRLRLSLCGHVYCLPCFCMYLFVSAESGQFPLRCAGCDDPVLMEDVQWVLRENYADLQWFINRSVSSMVDKHSDEYNHCSSPDCKLIYACKPQGGNTKFECPACGEVTCRSCRVPYHEGEACWLYRIKNSKNEYELALLDWMREDQQNRGVCPKCGHGIEKDGGCNKLHCSRCDANICWLCMKDFPSSGDAYTHLDEVHGGYM